MSYNVNLTPDVPPESGNAIANRTLNSWISEVHSLCSTTKDNNIALKQ